MSSATERLRAMLDERGMEWEACRVPTLRSELAATFWHDRDGNPCSAVEGADDVPDGMLSVQANLTPEQAIEATLGRGECHDTGNYVSAFECDTCGEVYEMYRTPSFCPSCGRAVRA